MTLYEMSQEVKALLDILSGSADTEGMTEEEIEQIIHDSMEAIGADDKLDAYAKIRKELEARAEIVKKEKMRLAALQNSLENNIKRLNEGIINYLHCSGQTKAETDLFRFSIRKTDVLEIADDNEVPSEFFSLEKKYDKARFKTYLKVHPEYVCKGVELKTNESLIIK